MISSFYFAERSEINADADVLSVNTGLECYNNLNNILKTESIFDEKTSIHLGKSATLQEDLDRIRENLKSSKRDSYTLIVNRSINKSLSRTIITSLTTFVVVMILWLFGGEVIHNFAFAMIIGVIVGTYSSVYIASPLVIFLHDNAKK